MFLDLFIWKLWTKLGKITCLFTVVVTTTFDTAKRNFFYEFSKIRGKMFYGKGLFVKEMITLAKYDARSNE